MLADTTDARPGIEEVYQTANNTSDLTVEGDRRGAGDVMIAAGWSGSRVGMALLRLHSEWDASEKPVKPTKDSIKAMVGTFQRPLPEAKPKANEKSKPLASNQAHHYALSWYAHEFAMLLGKLKALPAVRQEVTAQAFKWRMGQSSDPITRSDSRQEWEQEQKHLAQLREAIKNAPDDAAKVIEQAEHDAWAKRYEARRAAERAEQWARAERKAVEVIRFWLDQTCRDCCGLKWQAIANTPALSSRPCRACGGSGLGHVPHQQEGRKLANWMDSCVEDAHGLLKRNLGGMRRARNKVIDGPDGRVIIAAEDGTRR